MLVSTQFSFLVRTDETNKQQSFGGNSRARTYDLAVNSRLLCQLSYVPIFSFFLIYYKYIIYNFLRKIKLFFNLIRHCAYFNALRCEPVIVYLLVEFEPLTMGEEPVSNYSYETSVLTKIGIGRRPRNRTQPQNFGDFIAALEHWHL